MQYTYWPISQEVKAIRLSNLFSSQNVVEKYYSHFKKSKSSISLNQYSKVLYILFFFVSQVEDYRNWLKLSYRPLIYLKKAFWKTKRGLGLVFLPYFLHDFWRKFFLLLCPFTWPNFNVLLPLLREILGNMCIVIFCWPGCDVIKFKINLSF